MVFSWLCGVSRRWELSFLLCSGVIIVYTLRVNMSVAAPKMRDELGWSDTQKGFVLSAFYWGYAVGQIPASFIAQKYGSKHLFGLSILIPSVLTLLVPAAARYSFSLALVTRMCIGFFESASFPAIFHFLPHWVPMAEKTSIVPVIYSGMYIGEIIAFSMSGLLVESHIVSGDISIGNWPSVFYLFGLIGVLWYPIWWFMAYESPNVHPYITDAEKRFIAAGIDYQRLKSTDKIDTVSEGEIFPRHDANDLHHDHIRSNDLEHHSEATLLKKENLLIQSVEEHGPSKHDEDMPGPNWGAFFTTSSSLALLLGSWMNGWIGFLLLSEMPSYFSDELGFNLTTSGALCVVPYAGMLIGTYIASYLFKHLQWQRGWQTRSVRQTAQFITFFGATFPLVIAGYLSSSPYAAFAFVVLSQTLLGFNNVGLACCYLDLAPIYSGQFTTVGNTFGAIAGIVGPLIVAAFTASWSGEVGWRATFFLTFGMSCITLVIFRLFQTSEINRVLNSPYRPKIAL